MKDKNKELSEDNSLKYFMKLLFIVLVVILFGVGIAFFTISYIV